jgi:hypothetical protein
MLKEILSISGRPGLFKLISQGKNMFVAESLIDRKRIPVYSRDKVVSLGDIAIYTDGEEVPLYQAFTSIKQKENGEQIQISPSIKPEELRAYFTEILPDFDKDRVYPSDIKKIMAWYNLLIKNGFTEFTKKEETENKEENTNDETNNKNQESL